MPAEPIQFLVISGKKKDLEFSLNDSEIKIGRSRKNDVVLDDHSVSGHHARIYFEDRQAFIEDCISINGIMLNGAPTKKSPLQPGDVITIGLTDIKVLGEVEGEKALKIEGREESPSSSPKTGKDRNKSGAPLLKMVLVVMALCVVGVLAYVLTLPGRTSSVATATQPSPTTFTMKIFRLHFEKVQASAQNIFRYDMRIDGGALTIVTDDLKQGLHLRRSKALDPRALAGVLDTIQQQQIFSLSSLISDKPQGTGDHYTLELVAQGQGCRVQMMGGSIPDNFKRVCSTLENFGETELEMSPLPVTVEELRQRAQTEFQTARSLGSDRSPKPDNLFRAITAYQRTIWYLDTIDPKSTLYTDAIRGKQEAGDELERQLAAHKSRAESLIQHMDWKGAMAELNLILQKLPDPSDQRHVAARLQLIDVEKRSQ